MKNINKYLGIALLIEGLYFLYTLLIKVPQILATFDPSNIAFFYVFGVWVVSTILFILAGIGIWKNKKWAVVCGWVAVILPQLLKLIVPFSRIPFQYNYLVLGINILVLIYLSVQWKKYN